MSEHAGDSDDFPHQLLGKMVEAGICEKSSHIDSPGCDGESIEWDVPNQFPPNTRADRHAHAADTIYVIMRGSMTFNDGTGWYKTGDVRWVRANHTYGPEESGPDGCEFILVSMGPIDVQWESGDTYQANA